jgi:DNA-binding NtrC family response regulator
VDTAVEAMHQGAFDFHEKPLNLEHFQLTVARALEKASLTHAFDYLRHEQPYIYNLEHILAESEAMQQVLHQVARVAPTDVTVLLTGETGTGKSLIAGAIHANSPRRDGTLVTVNCAALTETLLESELFGHEKGAFTGAHKARAGRFQQAHGGTLFLDEVGDMSPAIQAKVLRAIEDKVIQRVGGSRSIQVDVRILAATNVDLELAVREGGFRRDLFYRLNVTPIRLPPLKERKADVAPLAELFLRRICTESGRPAKPFSEAAQQSLREHDWPGNIRELRNAVERAVLFSSGPEITPADLGLSQEAQAENAMPAPPTLDLEELERWAIRTALERTDWVQSRAAELLGITPRALSYKLDKIGLDHPKLAARRRRRR